MFSVIMSVYNERLDVLSLAIESVLKQTYTDFEFIIVLDNPDNIIIRETLHHFESKDKRVKLMINKDNIGLAKSLNKAIDLANRDFIIRMDANDIALPNRFIVLHNSIDRNVDVYFSQYNVINDHGEFLKKSLTMPTRTSVLKRILKQKNIICHPTVMIKSEVMKREKYSELRISEDYDLWIRLISSGYKFKGINEVLLDCRIVLDGMTASDYYKSYFALDFIWSFYNKHGTKSHLTNEFFEEELEKRVSTREKYNMFASEYFQIINGKRNASSYLRLVRIFISSPHIFNFFLKSVKASILRRIG